MIELKNINKIYKSKKGNITTGLDNVSLKFGNNGMTFILGKSGSGKSTLLNIIGGLDQYDSGEMYILGKSSHNFSQTDFDSYRNTYIGFVFQDFNILEDYNVYENIALAMQLGNKKIKTDEINELLNKLELTQLKTRKVNELSGGQKQRVAIARALIKNPKIILADEPTGNLDSTTGKQVMDLLKEISKDRLVIIVSHDNEAAKKYGDRIIEIKDGKVFNDTDPIKEIKTENYKPIKSKLPLKESFKLGLGSLRNKKIKLCFTILLTSLSLLFLGLTYTLSSYNVNLGHAKLLKDKKEEFVQIEKYKINDYGNGDVYRDLLYLKENDIKSIQEEIPRANLLNVYRVIEESGFGFANIYDVFHINSEFDGYSYNYGDLDLEIVEDSNFKYLENKKILGRKPTNINEIVISNVVANEMIDMGATYYGDDKVSYPKSYDEILNSDKLYYFRDSSVKIVGIIQYDLSNYSNALEKFEKMKNEHLTNYLTNKDSNILMDYYAKLNNIYNKVYAMEGFVNDLSKNKGALLSQNYHYELNSDVLKFTYEGTYYSPSYINEGILYYDGGKWVNNGSLREDEIVINLRQLPNFDYEDYRKNVTAYINQHLDKEQLELEKEFFVQYINDLDLIGKKVNLKVIEYNDSSNNEENFNDLEIVGVTGLISDNDLNYYISYELLSKYETDIFPLTSTYVLENSQSGFKKLMDNFKPNEEISIKSSYSYDVYDIIRVVEILKKIAFYVALVLVIFTIILMANFMFSSISYRKREIGILRGLGARSIDTVKIFLWEGIIIATFVFILSIILYVIGTNVLNNLIMGSSNMILTPFIITINVLAVMFLVVYVIVIISSILPILKISKMKPIDAILKK